MLCRGVIPFNFGGATKLLHTVVHPASGARDFGFLAPPPALVCVLSKLS